MKSDKGVVNCRSVLGPAAVEAMARADRFMRRRGTEQMLARVGGTVETLALRGESEAKRFFPASFGGGRPSGDDLLAGRGVFYVTERGKVMLDCTSGHYQMTWGYNHPELAAATAEAMKLGVVWDNHSNIPSLPVKRLSERLVTLAGGAGLDRVLLGVCTGSVACSAALKIILARYAADQARTRLGPPAIIVLAGNYHGTDIVAQTMRGMWPGLVCGMETVQVEPNDEKALRAAFARCGKRAAGFWAEPIMMNREAIAVEPGFLQLARELCTRHGALMAIDEIQTGFWYPEVFLSRRLGIAPDLLVVGKGMTAGFHPLSALLYRRELDILQQYDAVSTNGNASLAAFVGLCNLRLIARDRRRLARLERRHFDGFLELAADFPALIERVNGAGYLSGLKFRDRGDALGFHQAALARGLWIRAHAYYPGHRTVLLKHSLAADEAVIDYVLRVMRDLLRDLR